MNDGDKIRYCFSNSSKTEDLISFVDNISEFPNLFINSYYNQREFL